MWSPHGLGVRGEDGSAAGSGRKRSFQAMWGGGGSLVEVWRGGKGLVACGARPFEEGCSPFKKGAPLWGRACPFCLLLMAGGSSPLRRFGDFLLFFHAAKS